MPIEWVRCIFRGPAPPQYTGWWDFINSDTKTGVVIRAIKEEDLDMGQSTGVVRRVRNAAQIPLA